MFESLGSCLAFRCSTSLNMTEAVYREIAEFARKIWIVNALRCDGLQHLLIQIVHFHECNSGHVVHSTHDRGVVTRRQICDDRRLPTVARSVAAVPNSLRLIAGDYPADDCMQPVIIRGNQSSSAIVQLQGRIIQCIGNSVLSKLRPNGANNYLLRLGPLDNEAANHHVVTCLNKGASRNVSES